MSDKIAAVISSAIAVVCSRIVAVSTRSSDDRPSDGDEMWPRDYDDRLESRIKSQVQAYNIVGILRPLEKYWKPIATVAIVCLAVALAFTGIYYFVSRRSAARYKNCGTCNCHRYRSDCCVPPVSKMFTEYT